MTLVKAEKNVTPYFLYLTHFKERWRISALDIFNTDESSFTFANDCCMDSVDFVGV